MFEISLRDIVGKHAPLRAVEGTRSVEDSKDRVEIVEGGKKQHPRSS